MSKDINLNDYLPIVKEKLESGGEFVFTPKGSSMLPMLNGTDSVTIKKCENKLLKYDLPFYYRERTGQFVIHRIIGFDKSGGYVISGDNQIEKEYGITDSDIIGVVVGFNKEGKYHSVNELPYKLYCVRRVLFRPVRRVFRGMKRRIVKK